jgi:iron complex outermembrane receptor protein
VAEQKYLDNDGHVAIESFRAGISHRYEFSKHVSNVTSGFLAGKTLDQTFAVGLNEENTVNFGGRSEFQFDFDAGKIEIQGVSGGEFQKTNGMYNSYAMFGGVLGDHRSDNAISTMQYNAFTKWDVIFPKAIKLTVGASSNFLEYDINDRLANVSNPNHNDASGYKSFEPVITPRVALQKTFNKKISAYVSVSQGYSPPTTSDVVIPYTGAVNNELIPERGTQYEIGTKGSVLDNKLSWQLAVFSLNVSDKLTSQAVADTSGTILYSYSVNAGDQTNNGLELALSYKAINSKTSVISYLRPFATFTYSDFKYNDFRSDNNNNVSTQDFSGNTVIGVPPIMFNAGLDIASKYGFYLNSSFKYVDEMYITFDNEHAAPSYTLLSAKLGYKKDLGDHFSIDVFAGGNNLTNSLYYNMVFINWEKGPQPAVYSPGSYAPTFFGGLNLKYIF